jgi:GR25 family glycosyltransferase involved in LPS biosynthesis
MSDISEILLYLKNEKEFYTNKKPTITEPIRKKYIMTLIIFLEILIRNIESGDIDKIFIDGFKNDTVIKSTRQYEYDFKDGFFINLKESDDRRKNIENMDFLIKMNRFEAIRHKEGDIGCSLSHLQLLKNILDIPVDNENTYFLIIEDDISIKDTKKYEDFLNNLNKMISQHLPDMIILSGTNKIINGEEYYGNGFYRLLKSNTTSSYIINHKFIPTLIKKFEKGIKELYGIIDETDTTKKGLLKNLYSCDQIWNEHILKEKWLIYNDPTIFIPNLKLQSTISIFENNKKEIERNKELIENFNSFYLFNTNFNLFIPYLKYHKIWEYFTKVITEMEKNMKSIKSFYRK